MKKQLLIFLTLVLAFAACKKKDDPAPVTETPLPVEIDSAFICADIPAPGIFGWKDSTISEDKNINAFFFNPVNHDEIIYLVNGDLFGYNKMCCYNIPARQVKYLGDNGTYLPQANSRGWIVFGRSDYNIYKIKANGDSLAQLTFNNISYNPVWDRTGTRIMYYKSATGALPAYVAMMDVNGVTANLMPTELPNSVFARTSDKIAYLKTGNGGVSVYCKDLAINSETLLVTLQAPAAALPDVFQNLSFDNKDENLYWSNDGGVFKYNIAAARKDTVVRNCPNIIYARPVIARNQDVLTMSCHLTRPISKTRLFHQYKAMELDLVTKQMREVRVFP